MKRLLSKMAALTNGVTGAIVRAEHRLCVLSFQEDEFLETAWSWPVSKTSPNTIYSTIILSVTLSVALLVLPPFVLILIS